MKRLLPWVLLCLPSMLWAAPTPQGCLVDEVQFGTPAQDAGLKPGDQIIEANGKVLQTVEDLQAAVAAAGAELPLGVKRGEKTESITAKMTRTPRGTRLGVQCRVPGGTPRDRIMIGDQRSLSVYGGAALPQTTLDAKAVGAGDERLGSAGYIVGARFLNDITPRADIGLDLSYTDLGDHTFNISGAISGPTDLTMRSTVLLAVAKFHAPRPARVLPYALLGLGVHNSTVRWQYRPPPGTTISTGNNLLIDDNRTAFAMAAAGGVDLDITERYFAGFEGRVAYLGRASYKTDTLGNSIGVSRLSGAQVNFNFIAHIGIKFGSPPPAPLQLP